MDVSTLQIIHENSKLLKSDFVLIRGNYILGVDSSLIYLKSLILNGVVMLEPLCFNVRELGIFLTSLGDRTMCIMNNKILHNEETNTFCNINNPFIVDNILRMESVVNNIVYRYVPIRLLQFEENPQLIKSLDLSTSDGIQYIIIDEYVLPMFNNLLPILKGDKIDLEIFAIDALIFMARYTIHKKKKKDVDVYIICRHLK